MYYCIFFVGLERSFGLEPEVSKDGSKVEKMVHPEETRRKLEWMIDQLDSVSLACLQCVTMECKSVLLATAFLGRFVCRLGLLSPCHETDMKVCCCNDLGI